MHDIQVVVFTVIICQPLLPDIILTEPDHDKTGLFRL